MRLFKKKNTAVQISSDARCSQCRRRIRKGERYCVLDGRLYCEKCGRKKREWEAIEFALIMEDDE